MENEQRRKRLRKGTKSCIECRRRKIRCTWTSENRHTCDGCIARSLSCRGQDANGSADNDLLRTSDDEPTPPQDRMGRLERKLELVLNRLRVLESGSPQSVAHYNNEHTAVEDLPGSNPTHIRSMFEGAFVETGSASGRASPAPSARVFSAEQDTLRRELMSLFPSDRDVQLIQDTAVDWWAIIEKVIPPLSINSKGDLRAVLDHARKLDSDLALLALGLVTLSVTVHQIPPTVNHRDFDDWDEVVRFPERVLDKVEQLMTLNLPLAATVTGMECRLTLVKLQTNCGRIRRAWLNLRTTIALAELNGFPELVNRAHGLADADEIATPQTIGRAANENSAILKVGIWLQLCVFERCIGCLLNLPPITATRPAELPQYFLRRNPLERGFFWSLTKLGCQIRDRDENVSDTQTGWIRETVTIEENLEALGDTVDLVHWRNGIPEELSPKIPLLHQLLYFYLSLRTYLPLMLHPEAAKRTRCSHAMCLYSCRQMARCYIRHTRSPSMGLFPIRLADFLAFTAVAVMVLDREGVLGYTQYHDLNKEYGLDNMRANESLLEDLFSALKQSVADQQCRVIASQAVKAIEAIREALSNKDPNSPGNSVRIPLLGTMRVRRRSVPNAQSYMPTSSVGAYNVSSQLGMGVDQDMRMPHVDEYQSSMSGSAGGGIASSQFNGMPPQQQQQQQQPMMDQGLWVDWVAEAAMVDAETSQDSLWLFDENSFRF